MSVITQSGFIGSADIQVNTPIALGTVGMPMTVQIAILNRNLTGDAATVKIAISDSDIAPVAKDWIDFGGPQGIPAKGSRDRGGIPCGANQTIWVQSETFNISARAGGVLLP